MYRGDDRDRNGPPLLITCRMYVNQNQIFCFIMQIKRSFHNFYINLCRN